MAKKSLFKEMAESKGTPIAAHKPKKSVHIQAANNGFVVTQHGGDHGYGENQHVAKSWGEAMKHAKAHMGVATRDHSETGEGD